MVEKNKQRFRELVEKRHKKMDKILVYGKDMKLYKVLHDKIEVAEIIAIGNREDAEVYKEAFERIKKKLNNSTFAV